MFHSPWMFREQKSCSGAKSKSNSKEVPRRQTVATADTARRSARPAGPRGSMNAHSSPGNNVEAHDSNGDSSSESRDLAADDSQTESTGVIGSGEDCTPDSHVVDAGREDYTATTRTSDRNSVGRTDESFQSLSSLSLSHSAVLDVGGSFDGSNAVIADGTRQRGRGYSQPEAVRRQDSSALEASITPYLRTHGNVGLSSSWSGNTESSTPPPGSNFRDRDNMGNTHWSHSYTGVRQPVFMRSSCRANRAQLTEDLNEIYVPILGYENMEQRARFTVFKLHVQKNTKESWFIFRRYTDFVRLNEQLQYLFPNFRLALPPKKWFGNNFDPMFLEDRQLGLQAFLNNICGHKDIVVTDCVREFLCVDDPPGPHDSLEESRALCESLEETIYSLKRDMVEKDRKIETLAEELSNATRRLEELSLQQIISRPNDRVLPVSSSGSDDIDRRSCAEADQEDYSPQQEDRPMVSSYSEERLLPVLKEDKIEHPPVFTAIPLDSPVSDKKAGALISQSGVIEVT